jgi:excisionase family DNA binding protein
LAEDEELLTPREVARRLRVSEETVRRWAIQGKIRGIQLVSGRWRIPASELTAMLEPSDQKRPRRE